MLWHRVRDLWVLRVLAEKSEKLTGPREFLRKFVGVAAPNDLAGLILVKILHFSEDGDVEQVARTSKYLLVFAIAFFLSLNSTHSFKS